MLIARNPEVIDSILDNEVCLFLPSDAEYFNLNSTGSFIWNILTNPNTSEFIISEIMKTFDAEKSICSKEVNLFIENGLKNNIFINIK